MNKRGPGEVGANKDTTERLSTTESGKPGGSKPGISLSGIKTFESLSNPAYRLYLFGMMGQWGSMNMQLVTRSLLIYRLTGSAAILGLMSLASA